MELFEIERKIEEYTAKLNTKSIRVTPRGKHKIIGIPSYREEYYKNEIDKLKRQKLRLEGIEVRELVIGWENIRFEDGQIRININNILSEPFPLLNSRKSYKYLKPYILKCNLNPLSVSLFNMKISSINNLEAINSIIDILSIQNEVNKYFDDFQSTSINKILFKLKDTSNKSLFDFFKLKEKSLYMAYLCNNQNSDYKLTPTTEILTKYEKKVYEEDTFLFTIRRLKSIYIVWESSLINKATYIFKTSEQTYSQDVQRIFDWIASNESCKRKKLRYSIKTKENPFNGKAIVKHNQIDSWRVHLENIMHNK